jgi:hypothetical protein
MMVVWDFWPQIYHTIIYILFLVMCVSLWAIWGLFGAFLDNNIKIHTGWFFTP